MIAIAVLMSAALFQLSGYSAVEALTGFIDGAITGPGALLSTVRWAIPLALVAAGVVLSFRAGFFNVGAQGQLYLGAIAAAAIAPVVPGPPAVAILVAAVAAAIAGAAWSMIAALLKTLTGADEVLTTLMLNFIGTLVLQYVTNGPMRDLSGSGQVASAPPIDTAIRITGSSGVSVTAVLVVILVLGACWLLINRTTFGLSATIVGRNSQVAARQGVDSTRVVWTTFALSGGLAGLAGAIEVLGPTGRLIQGFSPDLGFTAVLVALVASLSIIGVVFSSLFFGALAAAIQYLPIVTDLPRSALDVLQGVVALLITVQLRSSWLTRRAGKADADAAAVSEPGPDEVGPDDAELADAKPSGADRTGENGATGATIATVATRGDER